ncbi:MAG: NAD(P)H-hydrate epimerase [Lachnospiraceae bacterium]
MKYLVDSMEMRAMDRHSIDTIGIPSIVLMERAALSAVQEMKGRLIGRPSILVFCGTGNNGADGLAMARMLTMDRYRLRDCCDWERQSRHRRVEAAMSYL